MPIQTIQGRRLYLQIADQLRHLIDDGEFAPGEHLPPERELAKLLGVSRTSVREALIALEIDNRVRVRVGSGVEVLAFEQPKDSQNDAPLWETDPELSDEADLTADLQCEIPPFSLLEARRLIEPEAAALAAQHATPAQLQGIRAAYERNVHDNQVGSHTHPGDRLFHIRIGEASGNPAFALVIRHLLGHKYGPLFRRLQELYTPTDMPHRSEQGHLYILDALEARDLAGARRAMALHLDAVINDFSRV